MALLFTFGCGTLGELGTTREDDTWRAASAAVAFPVPTPHTAVAHGTAPEAVALGTDHSLAVVGGRVYRWGLLGGNMDFRSRGACSPRSRPPEVVPEPTSISELVPFMRREGETATPDGKVCAVECGGSNSFMLTREGEVFTLSTVKAPTDVSPDCLRHLWGSRHGGPTFRVTMVAAGWRHCLMLTEAGNIFALGDDEHGQCAGVNTGKVAVPMPAQHLVVGIAAGACHSIAWDSVGVPFAWGHGGSGRLGVGGTKNRRAPARVAMIRQPVKTASCGGNFSMYVTNNGQSMWACGGNQYGQLGLSREEHACTAPHQTPALLAFPPAGHEIISLQCGANHVLCLTKVMENAEQQPIAWAWGCASSGQCGLAEGEKRGTPAPALRSTPTALAEFLAPSLYWPFAVAAGRSHSAILAHASRPASLANLNNTDRRCYKRVHKLPEAPQASRRLPQVPNGQDSLIETPRIARRLPNAPIGAWTCPEGHSISHIRGLHCADDASVSPLQTQPQLSQTMLSAATPRDASHMSEQDIIEAFCSGLSCPIGNALSATYTDSSRHSCIGRSVTKPTMLTGSARKVFTGAGRAVRPNASRSLTPQRKPGGMWPRPPPSWSFAGRWQPTAQPNRARTQSPRGTPSLQSRSVSPSHLDRHRRYVIVTSGARPSPALVLPEPPRHVPEVMQCPEPVVVERVPDDWTGIHKSLKGLSCMIANIGAPARTSPIRLGDGGDVEVVHTPSKSQSDLSSHYSTSRLSPVRPTLPLRARYSPPYYAPPGSQMTAEFGSPRECGSDTALDFSPRSVGNSPNQSSFARGRAACVQPPSGTGVQLSMPHVPPAASVTESSSEPCIVQPLVASSVQSGSLFQSSPLAPGHGLDHSSYQINTCQAELPSPSVSRSSSKHCTPVSPPPLVLEADGTTSMLGETPARLSRSSSKISITSGGSSPLHILGKRVPATVSSATSRTSSKREVAASAADRERPSLGLSSNSSPTHIAAGDSALRDSVEGILFPGADDMSQCESMDGNADVLVTGATDSIISKYIDTTQMRSHISLDSAPSEAESLSASLAPEAGLGRLGSPASRIDSGVEMSTLPIESRGSPVPTYTPGRDEQDSSSSSSSHTGSSESGEESPPAHAMNGSHAPGVMETIRPKSVASSDASSVDAMPCTVDRTSALAMTTDNQSSSSSSGTSGSEDAESSNGSNKSSEAESHRGPHSKFAREDVTAVSENGSESNADDDWV